jgi:epoxyqueuosine reductase
MFNLTRREFLRALGLTSAGVTLSVAAPGSVLARETMDQKAAPGYKRPFWVKEQALPTTEVAWDQVKRFNEGNTCRGGFANYVGKDKVDQLTKMQAANLKQWELDGKPGYTTKDFALQAGVGAGKAALSFIGPRTAATPEKRGVPKYEGSPEEASAIVTAALRHMGAATVGFVELDPNTTQKLIYSVDPDGHRIDFADVPDASEDKEKRVIPNSARWAVVYTVQMSEETMQRSPTVLGSQTTTLAYTRAANIQNRLQEFLWALGYMGLGEASTNSLGIAPAFGVMAGLGELSRLNRLITPEYGPMVRVFKLVTNLPLAPTKPINAGILEFCKHCKKCAENCPSKSLSMETEPSWQVQGGWNNPGHKAWFENSASCRSYWSEVGTNCGMCFASCPFTKKNSAAIHTAIKASAALAPGLGGLFKSMDDIFYPSRQAGQLWIKSPEEWWGLNLAEYGINTTQGDRVG